ncbi:hypothetical protein WN48_10006 [Eufriesea mexicana]|uniref:Uncharacterized protein n=1 Tax=Eufriesea mexicana TaxID=516756 RepID=A0A310SIR9_9HYME|nr:hypothetical protein WN48_10006 [Eufriesea mexicana]
MMPETEYKNGFACTRGNNSKVLTQPVDILLCFSTVVVAVDCSLYFVAETVVSNSKAAAKTVTSVMSTRISVEVTVENRCGFAEAMVQAENNCGIVEKMVKAGNRYEIVVVTEMAANNYETVEAMVKVESNYLVALAGETFANSFVEFEVSVSNVSNWQVVGEKVENT